MEKKDGALRGAVQNSDREENAYTITVYAKRKRTLKEENSSFGG